MNAKRHAILCIDDEENILNALKRLLRGENYRILTAANGADGLQTIQETEVHLVISDQRMPGMSGIEFLTKVKERFPDIIRIVLSGYTDVDTITEAVNQGHIYKFILKPWNDQNLKLEIKQGLEQYELIKTNRILHEKVLRQNEELVDINAHLELIVQTRTQDLEIKNQALELTQAILEDVPLPVIGVGSDLMIVFINHCAQTLGLETGRIEIGKNVSNCFPEEIGQAIEAILCGKGCQSTRTCRIKDHTYDFILTPLSGRFCGQGVILTVKTQEMNIGA